MEVTRCNIQMVWGMVQHLPVHEVLGIPDIVDHMNASVVLKHEDTLCWKAFS